MAGGNQSEQIWLVKSAGVVRGPFDFIELINELKKRNIAILDEVRNPKTRWNFIREQKELADIVKIIREEDAIAPNETGVTHTNVILEPTKSLTADASTDTTHKILVPTEETTPVPEFEKRSSSKKVGTADSPNLSKPKMKKIDRVPIPFPQPVPSTSHYSSVPKIFILLPILLIAIVAWSLFELNRRNHLAISSEELVKLAEQYLQQKSYRKALTLFEKADGISQISLQAKRQYLTLLLTLDGDLQKIDNLISDLETEKNLDVISPAVLKNWKAMLLHKKGKFAQAETELESALAVDQSFPPAVVNRITNDFFARHPAKALQHYKEAQAKNITHQNAFMSAGLSLLQLDPSTHAESIQALITELKNWIKTHAEYQSENVFLIAALHAHAHQLKESESMIEKLMQLRPREIDSYLRENDFLYSILNWDILNPTCEQLSKIHVGKVSELYVAVYCTAEKGDYQKAWKIIEKIQKSFPETNSYIGFQAILLKNMNRIPEAKLLVNSTNSISGKILMIELCFLEKDLNCSESAVKEVLTANPNNLRGLYWSAKLALFRNNKELAKLESTKGLIISPQYLPLLDLREEMHAF